mgnify:CR=1 FL=1
MEVSVDVSAVMCVRVCCVRSVTARKCTCKNVCVRVFRIFLHGSHPVYFSGMSIFSSFPHQFVCVCMRLFPHTLGDFVRMNPFCAG